MFKKKVRRRLTRTQPPRPASDAAPPHRAPHHRKKIGAHPLRRAPPADFLCEQQAAPAAAASAGAAAGGAAAGEPAKQTFSLTDLEVSTTLGTGTFGRVRLVKVLATQKHHALKILKKSEIIRLKQVDHIKSEVVILKMVSHPFIVNLIGHFQDERRLYMVLEYVHGGELFSHLRREGRFSDEHGRYYAAQIVLAFAYLHGMHIVYRDLKPENLLIQTTGALKITDFGFAKQVPEKTWTLCGTPEYLAPEIIQSKGHGKPVDWWALGVLIFEMLAGYPPFYDENPFGIYQKILAGKIEFPRQFDSKAKDIVKKLLTADRTKRLGCGRPGPDEVKKNNWFKKTDWNAVFNCTTPAPYIPEISSDGDTHHFEPYADSVEDLSVPLTGKDREMFLEFNKF